MKRDAKIEFDIINKLTHGHKNIVKFYELIITEDGYYLVYELGLGGSLLDHLQDKKKGKFEENEARVLILQIIEAVEYMHSQNVVHLDIKPANIVIKEGGNHVRLIDFGVSRNCDQQDVLTTGAGTKDYYPPEKKAYMNDKSLPGYNGFQSDAWGLTVTLYNMVTN